LQNANAKFHKVAYGLIDIIQARWKTLTLLDGKFTQNNTRQIVLESAEFYGRCDKNTFWCFFGSQCIYQTLFSFLSRVKSRYCMSLDLNILCAISV